MEEGEERPLCQKVHHSVSGQPPATEKRKEKGGEKREGRGGRLPFAKSRQLPVLVIIITNNHSASAGIEEGGVEGGKGKRINGSTAPEGHDRGLHARG